jgi:hypothetical protein
MENTIANIRILDVVRLVHEYFIFVWGETTQGVKRPGTAKVVTRAKTKFSVNQ